ncbi:MAG: hypothetical protein Q8O86_08930 [Dehalococcoidia bacterium]|nr:hypothetical protein [Dehalococcoidia bacterium]
MNARVPIRCCEQLLSNGGTEFPILRYPKAARTFDDELAQVEAPDVKLVSKEETAGRIESADTV